MPGAPSSFLFLVVRPGARSSVLAPNSNGLQPLGRALSFHPWTISGLCGLCLLPVHEATESFSSTEATCRTYGAGSRGCRDRKRDALNWLKLVVSSCGGKVSESKLNPLTSPCVPSTQAGNERNKDTTKFRCLCLGQFNLCISLSLCKLQSDTKKVISCVSSTWSTSFPTAGAKSSMALAPWLCTVCLGQSGGSTLASFLLYIAHCSWTQLGPDGFDQLCERSVLKRGTLERGRDRC